MGFCVIAHFCNSQCTLHSNETKAKTASENKKSLKNSINEIPLKHYGTFGAL